MRRFPSPIVSLASTLLLCSLAAACSMDESSAELEDHSDKDLLVRVHRGSEQSVSFHALQSGQILITQTGEKHTLPLELSDEPLAAFQQAAPGIVIPELLVAAAQASGEPTSAAIARPSISAEPVIIDLDAPVAASSFPRSSFSCWARNRISCVFDQNRYRDDGTRGVFPQTFNTVWAVDREWIRVKVYVYYPNGSGGNYLGDTWQYETYDGQWRTWSATGNLGVYVDANYSNNASAYNVRFHYSSAGAQ